MITCKIIKNRIETLSGINDIGIKSKKREISDIKTIYCKLAKEFAVVSLESIGSVLREGYNHASVLHNLNKFNELGSELNYYDIYKILYDEFTVQKKVDEHIEALKDMSEVEATLMSFANFLNNYEGFKDIRFYEMVKEYIASEKKEKALKESLENRSCYNCIYYSINKNVCFLNKNKPKTIKDPENYSCNKWNEIPF